MLNVFPNYSGKASGRKRLSFGTNIKEKKKIFIVTIKELINSPLLPALVVGGLGSIMLGMVGFVILVMLPIAIITSGFCGRRAISSSTRKPDCHSPFPPDRNTETPEAATAASGVLI